MNNIIKEFDLIFHQADIFINKIISNTKSISYISYIISEITDIDYNYIINNIHLCNPNINEDYKNKEKTLDNLYENDNLIINIEVNNFNQKGTLIKNNTYIYELLARQLPAGSNYNIDFKKIIQININNYDSLGENDLIYTYTLRDTKYNKTDLETFRKYDVNMDFLRKLPYNEIKENKLYSYLYIFLANRKELLELMDKYEDLKIVGDLIVKLDEDKDFRLFYNKGEFDKSCAKSEGIEQGIEQGSEQKQLEIIKNMLNLKMDDETITKVANITPEELSNIKKELNN